MTTLYYAKGTAAVAPHIMLEEIGTPYTLERLDFANKDQTSDAYLKVNPKGRVPALLTDKGILTETPAILAYLAQMYPDTGLLPADPFDFAEAQAFNTYLAATVHVNHAHKQRGHRWSDDPATYPAMQAKVTENMTECARMIEAHYFKGPWVMGEQYTLCDPYLFVVNRWIVADGVDMAAFPKLTAHTHAMWQRPAVKAIMPLHE
ncbi:MAG: glutathione S-transferase family protein [Pseudomonadota bacterium]